MPKSPTIDPLSAQNAHSMARGLGWFSIGLGLAEVLAPRALTRGLGMEGHEQIVRAYGVREIATGLGFCLRTIRAVDMGTCGGRCARYRHARNWIAAGQSEKGECRTCSGRRCRRHGAGCRLWSFTRASLTCTSFESKLRRRRPAIDYHRRTGFPKAPEQMRGAARDFEVPRDMRTPEALRPFPTIPI